MTDNRDALSHLDRRTVLRERQKEAKDNSSGDEAMDRLSHYESMGIGKVRLQEHGE